MSVQKLTKEDIIRIVVVSSTSKFGHREAFGKLILSYLGVIPLITLSLINIF
jgi:hypothetical protein